MVAPEIQGIDLFKIANRSISGWVPSFKMGSAAAPVKLPFCSQLEERLLLWLEYHPLVVNYARGDIDEQFATFLRAVEVLNYWRGCRWHSGDQRFAEDLGAGLQYRSFRRGRLEAIIENDLDPTLTVVANDAPAHPVRGLHDALGFRTGNELIVTRLVAQEIAHLRAERGSEYDQRADRGAGLAALHQAEHRRAEPRPLGERLQREAFFTAKPPDASDVISRPCCACRTTLYQSAISLEHGSSPGVGAGRHSAGRSFDSLPRP